MKILVVSDTHKDFYNLKRAIEAQPQADVVIHLGDGEDELDDMRYICNDKMFFNVRGNCDFCSSAPEIMIREFNGKRIFATHGHLFGVKYSTETIVKRAFEEKADILLFGHTHNAVEEYRNGLYVLNPGSLRGLNGTYGLIDINQSGIMTNIVKIQ